MNLVEVIGNLGNDPETRQTPNGHKLTTFRIADRVNVKRGERDEVIWWRVTIWGNAYERLIPHLKKGSFIIVHGDMKKPEIYKDREGRQNVSMELRAQIIRLLPGPRSDREEGSGRFDRGGGSGHNPQVKVEYGSQDRPGGFTPGRGRAEEELGSEEDDGIPF